MPCASCEGGWRCRALLGAGQEVGETYESHTVRSSQPLGEIGLHPFTLDGTIHVHRLQDVVYLPPFAIENLGLKCFLWPCTCGSGNDQFRMAENPSDQFEGGVAIEDVPQVLKNKVPKPLRRVFKNCLAGFCFFAMT